MAAEMALVKPISNVTPKFGSPRVGSHSKFSTVRMSATCHPTIHLHKAKQEGQQDCHQGDPSGPKVLHH
ncbi:magnesium-protoporphyrin IX monomethyl ester [Spatholobus suberectus]|nr:magnesium-protoporphyrin IX monomethyl ester [Spatholobus suberectus]